MIAVITNRQTTTVAHFKPVNGHHWSWSCNIAGLIVFKKVAMQVVDSVRVIDSEVTCWKAWLE
jgi:hypothetical protein